MMPLMILNHILFNLSLIIDCWVLGIDFPLKLPCFFLRNVPKLANTRKE